MKQMSREKKDAKGLCGSERYMSSLCRACYDRQIYTKDSKKLIGELFGIHQMVTSSANVLNYKEDSCCIRSTVCLMAANLFVIRA
jgi:hypothetical protein